MFRSLFLVLAPLAFLTFTGCKTSGSRVSGNDGGSQPINDKEALEYKRVVLKCYKTGGTRVVKIAGVLRCYN